MRVGARHVAGVGLLVAALAIAYPDHYLGFDSAWSVVWGNDLAHGAAPVFDGIARSPTPHPLLNALATVLCLLFGANTAGDVLSWLGVVGLAGAAWLGALLAQRLAGGPAAVLVAGLILTRPFFALELGYATHDLPFLALVLGAGLAATGERPRPGLALGLLSLAGLLRPEAWPIAVAAALWFGRRQTSRRTAGLLLAAASAPIGWALQDALVTGDPLYSLHGTRDLASDLGRPSGSSTLPALFSGVGTILEPALAWAGLAALLLAARVRDSALATVVAGGALAALTFLVLGWLGLPALPRYLTVPACALVVTAAVVATRQRAARAALAVVLLASAPATLGELRDTREETRDRGAAIAGLRDLTREPAVRAAARRCRLATIPAGRVLPHAAFWLGIDPGLVVVEPDGRGPGVVLIIEEVAAAEALAAPPAATGAAVATPPQGARLLARSRDWAAYATC